MSYHYTTVKEAVDHIVECGEDSWNILIEDNHLFLSDSIRDAAFHKILAEPVSKVIVSAVRRQVMKVYDENPVDCTLDAEFLRHFTSLPTDCGPISLLDALKHESELDKYCFRLYCIIEDSTEEEKEAFVAALNKP